MSRKMIFESMASKINLGGAATGFHYIKKHLQASLQSLVQQLQHFNNRNFKTTSIKMHFSTVFATVIAAFVATSAALPTAGAGNYGGNGEHTGHEGKSSKIENTCSQNQSQACCNSADAVVGAECPLGLCMSSLYKAFKVLSTGASSH